MEVRYSPYNSPFTPAGDHPGVIWIGAEFRDMPHSGHVRAWQLHLGQLHAKAKAWERYLAVTAAAVNGSPSTGYAEWAPAESDDQVLPVLDELAGEGIKAAALRAAAIRLLRRSQKTVKKISARGLLAKLSIAQQKSLGQIPGLDHKVINLESD